MKEKPIKKKLIFDLTEDEYDDYVADANEIGASKIGLFRKMWKTYKTLPPLFTEEIINPDAASKYREMYLGLTFAVVGMLSDLSTRRQALSTKFINTPQQEWKLWVKRLHDVADCLEAIPIEISDEGFRPPKPPEWFGLGRVVEKNIGRDKDE